MPIAVFSSVREISSEDPVHVAENLLKENAGKKWKTKSAGEKSAYVILEFGEPQKITGIDIGNEHSAFVEVLVSKSGCGSDDFMEILLSSSFMTPIESKNSSNTNRVRCFSSDALIASTLAEKWKLVKIVCTQPFNKHVQYGLSFIKIHVAPNASKSKALVPEKFLHSLQNQQSNKSGIGVTSLGSFKLREESPDSESESKASLFQRWKASRDENNTGPSTAAAIRDASQPAALRRLSNPRPSPLTVSKSPNVEPKSEAKVLDRNRESLLFGDNIDDDDEADDAKKQRLSKHIEADKNRRRIEQEKQKEKSKRHSIDKQSAPSTSKVVEKKVVVDNHIPKERSQKRVSSPTAGNSTPAKKPRINDADIQFRPFNQLLRNVVLVISGIQNPDRANLRSKALAMGAKYKADWDADCTHLICAFKNTPKYNQVKGKGKIVSRSWLEKCHALKKYLPWRRYALDTTELGKPESDEEILDESMRPAAVLDDVDEGKNTSITAAYDLDDNKDMDTTHQCDSGSDTEDELERVAQKNKKIITSDKNQKNNSANPKSRDVYEISTDEEDFLEEKKKRLR
ncbi:DNA repair protein XRCC1 [Scaptodrosophila lebanonensis]|uniref:DNA repair protein XRCC1 n=1 Tax=Drosophila lebanonensis TaxID=7225 RepID=A0A6J2U118_DROLE|nr:DNA repair protein XRCC1 [Scaptodrosophila lebanonensis]